MSLELEKIVSFAKRRGFVFPSAEIYGGLSSCYDYGPLGVELKNNVKKLVSLPINLWNMSFNT